MARPGNHLCLLFLAAFTATLPGCGQATLQRQAVFGTIAGAEGRSGLISFIPQDDGPATRVKVSYGEYEFDESNGPVPGDYRVVVQLEKPMDVDDGSVVVKGVPVPVDQARENGPEYERRSMDVSVSVPSEGSLQLDLELPEPDDQVEHGSPVDIEDRTRT